MAADVVEDLRNFHSFLSERIGKVDMSPEEALDEWRRLHPQTKAADEDLAAIREALDDVASGDRGLPFADFDREFRQRHELPSQP